MEVLFVCAPYQEFPQGNDFQGGHTNSRHIPRMFKYSTTILQYSSDDCIDNQEYSIPSTGLYTKEYC